MPTVNTTRDGAARYLAFGLRLDSELELPELPRDEGSGTAEVDIRLGQTPATLEEGQPAGGGALATPGALLLDVPPARYLVRGGREIIVERRPGSADNDVRLFLLGSAMGAMCHQRGLLPLHANVIEVDGEAIAFAGPSGSGKSTLAAHFHRQGRRVLGDDVCVVSFNATGQPLAWPGIPKIKLWGDALAAFGRTADDLDRVFEGEEKFSLPMAPSAREGPIPLTRIYVLNRAEDSVSPGVRRLSGADAFEAIKTNIYRPEFALPLGKAQVQFADAVRLARSTPVFAAARAWGFDVFEAEAGTLERHIDGVQGPSRD